MSSLSHDPKIRISADRGGTFQDFFVSYLKESNSTERTEFIFKLLSEDTSNYKDSTREGIRRVLQQVTGQQFTREEILPIESIGSIRLSTTVATNALLTRQGSKFAFLVTKGFKDLLVIGNQTRPKIFELNIKRPGVLYEKVIEIDERVTLLGYTSDPNKEARAAKFDDQGVLIKTYDGEVYEEGEVTKGLSGEAVRVLKKLDLDIVKKDLQDLFDEGYRSLAIVLMHAFTYPDHELAIQSLALSMGFEHVSISSQSLPMIRIIPRGSSTSADAYLTPILKKYIDGLFSGFDSSLREVALNVEGEAAALEGGRRKATVEFMRSDGGLTDVAGFSGLKSILSGPAGGVVGSALTCFAPGSLPIIALDVGGTSSDVSRYDGEYEVVFESTTAGIIIQSPQLNINTVGAGGGSILTWRNGLFSSGPQSAGSEPGAAAIRKGGPATITDANLVLGRLLPEHFPKIFGKSENLPIDVEASKKVLESLREEINQDTNGNMTLDEVAWGFIKVSNEIISRPIRALTEARGFNTSKHILAAFGGAGGQCCSAIAKTLGISTILIHRYSSVLSAYGMALSERVFETQEPSSETWGPSSVTSRVLLRIAELTETVESELKKQGFTKERIELKVYLNMRYHGTDSPLMVIRPDKLKVEETDEGEDWGVAFAKAYKDEFGFSMTVPITVDDIRIRGIGKSFDSLGPSVFEEAASLEFELVLPKVGEGKCNELTSVYYEETGRIDTPVYMFEKLVAGDLIEGPAIILDGTSTIVVDPNSRAKITSKHCMIELLLNRG